MEPTQAELAQKLIDEMECAGDDAPTVLGLLDSLACAGLKLAPDGERTASREYLETLHASVSGQAESRFTDEEKAIIRAGGVTEEEVLELERDVEVATRAIKAYPDALAAASASAGESADTLAERLSAPVTDEELERDVPRLVDWLGDHRVGGAMARLVDQGRFAVRWDPVIEDWRLVLVDPAREAAHLYGS